MKRFVIFESTDNRMESPNYYKPRNNKFQMTNHLIDSKDRISYESFNNTINLEDRKQFKSKILNGRFIVEILKIKYENIRERIVVILNYSIKAYSQRGMSI